MGSLLLLKLCLLSIVSLVVSSDITIFQDDNCKTSLRGLDTVNGYPDGLCKPLGPNLKSFQIVGLDPGCAVTLYGENSNHLSCSSGMKIVAELATCYNSSWIYYSIDGCLPPSSTKLPPTSQSTSSPASSTIPSPTRSPSTTSSPAQTQTSNHTGVIIGGIVGGASSLAIVFVGALLTVRRKRKPLPSSPAYELSNDRALIEALCREKPIQKELWAQDAATEMGRNSVYVPPVELPGDAMVGQDKKGLHPILRAHAER